MQIVKSEVDYPLRRKAQASKNMLIYPPRIVIEILQTETTDIAAKYLHFTLEVSGTMENVILEVSAPLSQDINDTNFGEGMTNYTITHLY